MATNIHRARRGNTEPTRRANAITLMKNDYRQITALFRVYEATEADAMKAAVVEQICEAVKVHTQIEEKILLPASLKALNGEERDLVEDALVEGVAAQKLVAEIEAMDVADEMFDGKVTILGDLIEHRAEEEEGSYFPAIEKSGLNLDAIGRRMASRKRKLTARMGRRAGRRPLPRPVG